MRDLLQINVFAMSNVNNDDNKVIVFNIANDAEVSDPITPQSFQIPSKGFSFEPWAGKLKQRFKVLDDSALRGLTQLLKSLKRTRFKFYFPFRHLRLNRVFSLRLPRKCWGLPLQALKGLGYSLHTHLKILPKPSQHNSFWNDVFFLLAHLISLRESVLFLQKAFHHLLLSLYDKYDTPFKKIQVTPVFSIAGLVLILSSSTALAKDFGVQGQVFPIQENNLLKVIEQRLQKVKESGKLQEVQKEIATRVQKSIQRPKPAEGVIRTQEEKSYTYDPTLVVKEDVKDHEGNHIAKKGTKLNPLDQLSWGKPLLLIDGDDPEQVRWGSNQEGKIVLVKGAPFELEKQLKRPIYFDQGSRIVKRFGILQVPCRISQAGRVLLVEEVEPK